MNTTPAEHAAQGDINDDQTRRFFTERGINPDEEKDTETMDIETAERLVIDSHEEQFDCTDCTTDQEILHEVTNTICLPEQRCIGAYPLQPTGNDELDTAYRVVLKHWLTNTDMYATPTPEPETRWRIVYENTPGDGDVMFTATKDNAEYIAQELTAANMENGGGTAEAIPAN